MSKPFKRVTDFLRDNSRRLRIVLAGIVFTLSSYAAYPVPQPVEYATVDEVAVVVDEVSASPRTDIRVRLSFNASATDTQLKMDKAFADFCKIEPEASIAVSMPFQEIREGLGEVSTDKVSIDGDIETGTINMAMLFPDGVVLSVNKRIGLHPAGVVGFNIMYKRNLLVSDVSDMTSLRQYLLNIQKG